MRKKVQLRVNADDNQTWLILDDDGVVLEGPGVEMVQAFCHLSGQSTYTLTKKQLSKYDISWEGRLRLVRQQSMYEPKSSAKRSKKKKTDTRKKPQAAAEAFAAIVDDEDFFD